jgi:hypothetical protein
MEQPSAAPRRTLAADLGVWTGEVQMELGGRNGANSSQEDSGDAYAPRGWQESCGDYAGKASGQTGFLR